MDESEVIVTATIAAVAFVTTVVLAATFDVRQRRIPKPITVGGFALALLLRGFSGWPALADGLLAAGVGFAVALPLVALRALGGGDAKLLVAVGAFLGPDAFPAALLYTALAGGVLALYTAARSGLLPVVLASCGTLVVSLVTLGRRGRRPRLLAPGVRTVPYGLAIAFGSLVAWISTGVLR